MATPFSADADRILDPPPAYGSVKIDHPRWDFSGENSNHTIIGTAIPYPPADRANNNTTTTTTNNNNNTNISENNSNHLRCQHSFTLHYNPSNPYQPRRLNRPGGSNVKESRLKRLLQTDTKTQDWFYELQKPIGTWNIVCQVFHYTAATIALCVAGIALKMYQDPWNQAEVDGGATLAYAFGGSIVACIAGTLSLTVSYLGYMNFVWGFMLQCFLVVMYGIGGALIGYGSYITRHNRICNNEYTSAKFENCYDIKLSAGWRCGIVTVAMCTVVILAQLVYTARWCINWLVYRRTESARWMPTA